MSVLTAVDMGTEVRRKSNYSGFFGKITGFLFLSVMLVGAINFTSGYVLSSYETSMVLRASLPSVGLFQIANILFWSVLAACFL
ncbi:hypothetical protein TDB9533_00053 [Thalassocella blandensis]|nr:hypothetical protein TDB9533_00053 [Thalassocella blandensis]